MRVDAYSRLGAYSDKYGISNVCSGLHENPNNLDFLGRVLSDISVIAKIRQF